MTEGRDSKNPEDFWFSLATLGIPKGLLGQHRVILRMRASKEYFLFTLTLSSAIFIFGAYMFGRIMGYF